MDEADSANDHIEREMAMRLRWLGARQPTGLGPVECVDCGDVMPEARRQLGLRLCVECATLQEKLARFRRQG